MRMKIKDEEKKKERTRNVNHTDQWQSNRYITFEIFVTEERLKLIFFLGTDIHHSVFFFFPMDIRIYRVDLGVSVFIFVGHFIVVEMKESEREKPPSR